MHIHVLMVGAWHRLGLGRVSFYFLAWHSIHVILCCMWFIFGNEEFECFLVSLSCMKVGRNLHRLNTIAFLCSQN